MAACTCSALLDSALLPLSADALAGVNSVDDDPNTMSMVQFGNFCRAAKMLDGSTQALATAHAADRYGPAAVRHMAEGAEVPLAPMAHGCKGPWHKGPRNNDPRCGPQRVGHGG